MTHSKCVFDNVVIMHDKYCKVPYIRDPSIRYSLVDHVDSDLRKLHWLGALTGTVFSQNMWYRFDSVFLHIYTFKNEIYAIAGCHKGKLVNVVRQLVDYRRYALSNANAIRRFEANLSILAVALQQMQWTYMPAEENVYATLTKAYSIEKADRTYQARKAKTSQINKCV